MFYLSIDIAKNTHVASLEGKHHKTCIGAVARKMCNIIYAVLKNNTTYQIPKQ